MPSSSRVGSCRRNPLFPTEDARQEEALASTTSPLGWQALSLDRLPSRSHSSRFFSPLCILLFVLQAMQLQLPRAVSCPGWEAALPLLKGNFVPSLNPRGCSQTRWGTSASLKLGEL